MLKTILHLCADVGSDTAIYADHGYNVIKVGKDIGVENFHPPENVYGVIANPVCTTFSRLKHLNTKQPSGEGMEMVRHCQRIIEACNPKFWVIENPATGTLRRYLGPWRYAYEPWWYGSPWTKKTALWGNFNIPQPIYHSWQDVPKNDKLWVRRGRKTSLVWLHKSALEHIPEFHRFRDQVKTDMCFRSLCSQNFAKAFFEVNQ